MELSTTTRPAAPRARRHDELGGLRGALWSIASACPLALFLAPWPPEGDRAVATAGALGLGALLVLLGALRLARSPRQGRNFAGLGVVLVAGVTTAGLLMAPGAAFVTLLAAGAALTRIYPRAPQAVWADAPRDEARGAAFAALACVVLGLGVQRSLGSAAVALLAPSLAVGLALRYSFSDRNPDLTRRAPAVLGALSVLIAAGLAGRSPAGAVAVSTLAPLGALLATRRAEGAAPAMPGIWEVILGDPARVLVATFAGICLAGGVLLSSGPAASGDAVSFLDALFMAVSATCVTGLGVIDITTAFSGLGRVILLLLIQVGGLGIMTFSAAALTLLGQRLSVRHERTMTGLLGAEGPGHLQAELKRVLGLTFVIEGLGAAALTSLFIQAGDAPGDALWRGVFTSISAFCNAGFALQSDSLVGYQTNPGVLHVVGLLIIFGGLGPAVMLAAPRLVRGGYMSLHARLSWVTAAVLLVLPALFIAGAEWGNTLAGLSTADRVHNAWFQSVTLRTAGFNSIDLAALNPATVLMMILMMFIGGGPGSTAGGIKTTTAAILFLAVLAAVRGQEHAQAFGRRIPTGTVYRAIAITTVGGLVAFVAAVGVLLTQAMPPLMALFEVVSALGTVGLTTGGTSLLDEVGKVLIILCMFMGRVGPLTLFLLLNEARATAGPGLPDENVPVG
ncbi:potassium transporter TrkH [Myxococcota bacterium]|nr:potassium transporter TrkH [Myxococcota bacterium]